MIVDRVSLRHPGLIGAVFLFPFFFLPASEIWRGYYPAAYLWSFDEDGLSEYAQFTMYFVAAILASKIAITFRKKDHKYLYCLYMAAALVIFFVSMEEISWGQRIVGIESPEYFQTHNRQKEFNLHNLDSVNTGTGFTLPVAIVFGSILFYLSFAWLLVPRSLTDIHIVNVHYLLPSWYLTNYFLSASLWFVCDACHSLAGPRIWQTQEVVEFLFVLGCLLFMVLGIRRLRFVRQRH